MQDDERRPEGPGAETIQHEAHLAHGGSETALIESSVAPATDRVVEAAPVAGGLSRLAPVAIASALFMEFIDSTALSTALPTLARGFHADPIHLKLALTSYLLALAVVAPAGGWIADRFGARRVFLTAMGVFLLGSICCGFSRSLEFLVASRILQGVGGAMMVPVGRLIIVGSTPKARLVNAMTWFTTPALVGPLIGPPLAGFVLGIADWPWIFFLNIPVGGLGMLAVLRFAPDLQRPDPGRFDTVGFLLGGVAISALVVLAETAGQRLLPLPVVIALAVLLAVFGGLFLRHVQRTAKPILDLGLLKYQTFRASLTGGTLVRLGVGATPFLTPLLLQVGLGWTPVKAGFVTIATGLGAMSVRTIVRKVIGRFGFRTVLLASGVGAAVLSSIPGFFRESTPVWLMFLAMFLAGMIRSTQFISANTIAYADVPAEQVTRASTLAAVVQQIGLSLGVSFGALMLTITRGGGGALTPDRFTLPFLMIGASTLLAQPIYAALNKDAGSEISGRRAGVGV
jgi:EmrB/QacA subfamily drug resistance transporter